MYTYKTKIAFSEVDPDLHITLPAILTEFQDCSLFHSDAAGLGVEGLRESGCIWLLSSWQVVIDHYPSLYEEITLSTWAYGWRNFFGFRNFTMTDAEGRLAVWANTNWIYTSLTTGHPVKAPQEVIDAYGTDPPLEMDVAPRKIAVPAGGMSMPPIPIRKSDIDANGHVNNERYVLIAQEFLPDGFVTGQLRAEYKKAAKYGDTFYPSVVCEDGSVTAALNDVCGGVSVTAALNDVCGNGIVTVALNDEDGKPYSIVEFTEKL